MSRRVAKLGPCVLEGEHVRLEPLRLVHCDALFQAGKNTKWTWFLTPLRSKRAIRRRIEGGLKAERRGQEFAFAVVMKDSRGLVGSTSYLGVVARHRRVEIGSTWYSKDVWGTVVNPECKFLLLKHAFEDWRAVRVQFVTDVRNKRSARAISKLGARLEGRLSNYGIRSDGHTRDVFVYSIADKDWSSVKSRLLARVRVFGQRSAPVPRA